jgi:DNA-binding MarR family transcriptional regulator
MDVEDDRVSAWRSLLLAQAKVLAAIEDDLARAGQIPLSWYDVLLELNAAPDQRMRMAEVADHVVLSRTRVSRLVDELQAEGLVERRRSPEDGRVTWACITAAGRVALRKAAPHYLASIEVHFTALLSERERSAITRALGRVVEHHDRLAASRRRR